jgi:lipopolysaccharide transport system permease protein
VRDAPPAPPSPNPASLGRLLATVGSDLVQYRELLLELTLRDLRIRYKQSVMGVLWAVLTPLVVVLAGAIVRLAFASLAGRTVSPIELGGLAVKSIGWTFFAGALGFGTASLTANFPLVTKVYFPRELLPLSAVITQVIDSAVGATALLVVFPFFGLGTLRGLPWIALLALLLFAFTLAVAMLAACANVFFRDARHIVQMATTFGIFFTPVFFDLDAFGPTVTRLFVLNPLTPLLEGARLALIAGHDLGTTLVSSTGSVIWTPSYLAYAGVWSLAGLLVSTVFFRRASGRFAEYV